jgi:L,D-transpeptidase YcbB
VGAHARPPAAARRIVSAALFALGLLAAGGFSLAQVGNVPGDASPELQSALSAARLEAMRWPDFTDLRDAVAELYAQRSFALLWVENGRPTPQALAILALLEGADSRGLPAASYDGLRWPRRVIRLQRGVARAEQEEFDLALTVNLLRLMRDLHGGRVDPRALGHPLAWPPKRLDLVTLAVELATVADPTPRLETLEPPFPGYRRLKHALVRYIELARERDITELPETGTVRPGDRYPGLGELAHLLVRLGDLGPEELPDAEDVLYEGALVEGVRAFQRRHGLDPDGRIGPLTWTELRVPLSRRALQIRLGLERWRWAPAANGLPPIVVNIPEFRLRAFDGEGRVGFSSRVIVGRAFRSETPVFADLLRLVIFRPYWNVPVSIARREIVPQLERDSTLADRMGYEVVGATAGPSAPETLAAVRRGALLMRQRPGPANALGRVKFIFPNEHSVYLHDTPAAGLFARARRDLSHGCIRVEDAAGLAAWVLRDRPEWTPEAVRAAMERGPDDRSVTVAPAIPVYMVYVTAVATEDGDVQFFHDVYGHDARLAALLGES